MPPTRKSCGRGSYQGKKAALEKAGVTVLPTPSGLALGERQGIKVTA